MRANYAICEEALLEIKREFGNSHAKSHAISLQG